VSNKNSFLKFLIISHEGRSSRWVRLPIIVLFLLLILIIVTFILFWSNLGKYVDITSIDALRSDNQRLRKKVEMLRDKKEYLSALSDTLLKSQNRVLDIHHLKGFEKETIYIYSIDSLLLWSKWIDTILKTSLKRSDSLLKMIPSILPVEGYIVKYFGKQIDPFTEKAKTQNGVNILAGLNSPVITTADGKIVKVEQKRGVGLYVEIAHWKDFITLYGHLLSTTVKEGEIVERGEIIGYVGESGRAPYPYIYYEVRKDSVFINPLNVIMGGI